MTSPVRFFILDPNLNSFNGHHFEYNQSVGEAVLRRGFEAHVLCHQDFKPNGAAGRVVYHAMFRDRQWGHSKPTSWRNDLMAFFEREKITAQDHVFGTNMFFEELSQIAVWAHFMPPQAIPHWHVVCRYDMDVHSHSERFQLSAFFKNCSTMPTLGEKVHFYSDTPALVEQYAPYIASGNKRPALLPIPQRIELLGTPECRAGKKEMCIAYLGTVRKDKGYHLLPRAILYVLKHLPADKQVRFLIHSDPAIQNCKATLDQLANLPWVSCPFGPLTPEDYYAHLHEADIVLLPYDAEVYKRRSSGPLSEATATGKVVVVPKNSYLETAMGPDCGTVFGHGGDFGKAIFEAVMHFDRLQTNACAYALEYRQRNNPDRLVAVLLEEAAQPWQPLPLADSTRKKALYVCDEWVLNPQVGTSHAGRCQLRYLHDQGFEVFVLVLTIGGDAVQRLRCETFCAELGIRSVWFGWLPSDWACASGAALVELSTSKALRPFHDDFLSDVWVKKAHIIDPDFLTLADAIRFDCVVMHYVHNSPILEKINLKGAPVICETSDYMAQARAATRLETGLDPLESALEIDLLSRCQGVSWVSDEEKRRFDTLLPPQVVNVHLVPVVDRDFNFIDSVAGCTSMLESVQAAGIMQSGFIEPLAGQLANRSHFDMLLVGLNNQLTAYSVVKFYREVFVPYLKPRGCILTIAGHYRPKEIDAGDTQVHILGRLNDLDPIYAMARMIILPIYYASGISIKTLEALRLGKPMIGTRMAFRGVSNDFMNEAEPLLAHTPEMFAQKILNLLADPVQRRANAEVVQKVARMLPVYQDYTRNFSRLLERAMPGFHARPAPDYNPSAVAPYMEFDDELLRFNVLLRVILLGGTPKAHDCAQLLKTLATPQRLAMMQRLFESFYINRTAACAAMLAKTSFFTEKVLWEEKTFEAFIRALMKPLQAAA